MSGSSAARLAPLKLPANPASDNAAASATLRLLLEHSTTQVRHATSARVVPINEAPRRLTCRDPRLEARLAAIRQAWLFHALKPDECEHVAALALERCLARRESLFREGQPANHVSLLVSGRLKLTQLSPAGAEVILKLKGSGDVVGGLGMVAGNSYPSTAQALEPCTALLWDTRTFEDLAERFPAIQRNAVRILAESLNHVEERFRELATEQVATRLARLLVRLLDQVGRAVEGAVSINLTREELAQMTGTTLFTVSRVLSSWEDLGVVGARREAVLVFDAQGLGNLAENA